MKLCPSYLSFILYNPIRKAFTDRDSVLDESGVSDSSVVLEVGAGNGFLTEAIAQRAKKVYAIELQHDMVRKLKRRTDRFCSRVETILCDIADCSIGDELADVAIMYYSFHEISRQSEAVKNISRAVKKNGILSIYEPTIEVDKAAMGRTVKMFEDIGFKAEAERNGLFTRFVRLRKL
ncbi:MAG: class I SAM-dependent methyltransferase [Thermodesulfovibrionales bacterium]|nr:class I SAM-dependent methyltransferase [Thermodesulfovibrionales bacterium]